MAVAVPVPEAPRGATRRGADADDSTRADRNVEAQTAESRGLKRSGDDPDDAARGDRTADDMSTVTEDHESLTTVDRARPHGRQPGPRHDGGQFPRGDLEWKDIGSGVIAKTFPMMNRLVTTSRAGPPMSDVHRRVVRSLATGKIIDDCIVDDTPDLVLNRLLPGPAMFESSSR